MCDSNFLGKTYGELKQEKKRKIKRYLQTNKKSWKEETYRTINVGTYNAYEKSSRALDSTNSQGSYLN